LDLIFLYLRLKCVFISLLVFSKVTDYYNLVSSLTNHKHAN